MKDFDLQVRKLGKFIIYSMLNLLNTLPDCKDEQLQSTKIFIRTTHWKPGVEINEQIEKNPRTSSSQG